MGIGIFFRLEGNAKKIIEEECWKEKIQKNSNNSAAFYTDFVICGNCFPHIDTKTHVEQMVHIHKNIVNPKLFTGPIEDLNLKWGLGSRDLE